MRYRLLWLGLFFAAACAGQATQQMTISWNEPITLSHKQEAVLPDNLGMIVFEELVKDHRCPIDAQCLTQGTATIAVTYTGADKTAEKVELSVGDNADLVHTFDGFNLELLDVKPLPKSGESPVERNYSIVIRLISK